MASDDDKLNSALNLMRRMPPATTENSLAGLIELTPHLTDELLNHVDQPLKVQKDPKSGKPYILCDYNRDGDSYRSPWTSVYYPVIDDGFQPSDALRKMEIEANALFDVYRKLYFEGGYSSVYFFNTDQKEDKSFGACFLIHKDVNPGDKGLASGVWDSIHVFEVNETDKRGNYEYKLTTTVMVSMKVSNDAVGETDLSGSLTQHITQTLLVDKDKSHIANLGKMIEDIELKIRNTVEAVYIQKTREVINGMRTPSSNKDKQWEAIASSLKGAVNKHGQH